jgi:dienelactone hydrolase
MKSLFRFALPLFVGLSCVLAGFGSPGDAHADAKRPFYPVEIESLDKAGLFSSEMLKIKGYVLEAETGGKAPGAVLAPACGGLLNKKGFVRPFYRDMAWHLKQMGITSVLIDGFNPRGRSEVCSQPAKERSIDMDARRKDSLAGLRYLRGRDDIDGGKVFLFTWGAAGSFQTMNAGSSDVEKVGGGFTAAVMFYPQCDKVVGVFAPYAPIQVFVGEKDT